ncbi:MAG: TonB-dependent receptor [Bacteroidales bacterium]|nr:TonB-dependent receptor [Bacteroidales bacterium]
MKKLILLTIVSLIVFSGMAQTGTIRGFVYEQGSGEPVIFTNVYLKGTSIGASTDVNGYFSITQVPPGNYTLTITYLGFDTISEALSIKPNELITKKIFMTKNNGLNLRTVYISASAGEDSTQTKISVTKITPKDISKIPSFGAPDLAQYLQVLPGVIFTGDQGGQLYIRGGSPIQNKVLLDGMVVYNPFHSIGLFSVFETEIIRNADVYTGGFGAEYGGRISSVMDITTRDGNKKSYHGLFGASPFGARLIFEGPIKKQKDTGGSSSFIIAAKNSYLSNSSKLFYTYVDSAGLPFDFRDIYGKISLNADNGSKINFFGFNFTDDVLYRNIASFDWKAKGGGANFVVIPGATPTLLEGVMAYSDYKITLTDPSGLPKSSDISGFNIGLNFTYFVGKNDIKYGLEMLGFNTNFQLYNDAGRLVQQKENTTEIAAYLKYKATIGKLLFEPSMRFHFYSSLSELSPEPRLAIKYNVSPKFRIKAAGGLYSQNLISASSDRDVVNLFYGFLSGPENLQDEFDGREISSRLQKAQHLIFGFEFNPAKHLTANLEFYYKRFSQLTNLNRNKVYDDIAEYYDKPDYLKKDFIIEAGDAEGIDLSLKYELERIYLWGAYSYGFINRYDGIIEYPPHYDRRHNVNIVGVLRLDDKQKMELSARWNFGSGFPFTQNAGFFPYLTFEDGMETDIATSTEQLGILYDDYNAGRLPTYHRLDVSLKRTFYFSETTILEANIGVTNAYNRSNIFYFDRITNARVDQLPMMPSIDISLKF